MTDLRLAFRGLRSAPVTSCVAVLSLALGIGANTAIFTLIDRLVLRPLPVAAPERLVLLEGSANWPNPLWEAIRDHLDLFDGGFAWSPAQLNLAQGGEAQLVNGIWASGRFFETLGVQAYRGRTFDEADDRRGGGPDGPVAVISHDYWQGRYGGLDEAIGRRLDVGGVPFTVVGVTPRGFFGPDVGRTFDVILPLGAEPLLLGANSALDLRERFWLNVMLRLGPSQDVSAATSLLRQLQPQIRAAASPDGAPDDFLAAPFGLTSAARGRSPLRARFAQPLVILMAVVTLVLLIACANVANVLLARSAARRHDASVRLAMGASRLQLARAMLVESLVLSAIGAALGLVFALWTSRLLVAQLSTAANPVFLDLGLDLRVLLFTALVAVATTVFFGTVPAWRASRVAPMESLVEHGQASVRGRRAPIAASLIVGQVALSLVLVGAAGLFVRTFVSLATRDRGFTSEHLLLVNVRPQMTRLQPDALTALYERVRESAARVPGVQSAALSDITPVGGGSRTTQIRVNGVALPGPEGLASVNVVSPGWFETYGAHMLAGRDFTARDGPGAPRVAVVNEAFARRYLNGENPVGTVIGDSADSESPIQIVGYVGDAVYRSLRDPAPPTIYTAFAQRPAARPFVAVTVRTATDATPALTRALTAAITEVHPALDLTFVPLAEQVDASLAQERLVATLAGFFGALALLLAALGLYGITTHAVQRRRGEIGIRMALGATHRGVVASVMAQVAVLTAAGLVVGAGLSWWAARFVSGALLYGVEPRDSGTLAGAALVLLVAAAAAGWIPARHAARIDPAVVLRES